MKEEQYNAGGKFRVTGQIYGTDLEVTGTVKVLTGSKTALLLGIAAIAVAAIGVIFILRKKERKGNCDSKPGIIAAVYPLFFRID